MEIDLHYTEFYCHFQFRCYVFYMYIVYLIMSFCVCLLGDSKRLITASADQTAKLWDVQKGAELFTFKFDSPVKSVDLGVGDKLVVITTDPFMGLPSAIHVKRISADPSERM